MNLQGKHVAILLEDTYEDQEFWYPFFRLQEAGADVTVIGTGEDGYESKHGYWAETDTDISSASADQFDGVVIPGGYAPDKLRQYDEVNNFVADLDQQGKMVAAICHAGWVPASADIVEGRQVTSYHTIKDDLTNAGADWTDREVVKDGNLITSRTPSDLPVFMQTIVGWLREN